MTSSAVLVEFLGLPGAGKSTIADGVIRLLRERRLPVRGQPVHEPANVRFPGHWRHIRRLRVLLRCTGFILCHPGCSIASTRAIVGSEQSSVKSLVRALISWFNVLALVQHYGHSDGVTVMDQGVFQAMWSLNFGGWRLDPVRMADRLGGRLPTPHLAVAVEASLPTIERRLAKRPVLSRLQEQTTGDARRDDQLMARALEVYEAVKKAAMAVAEQRGDMQVLVVENDEGDDIDVNTSRIADCLQAAWSQTCARQR